jgi:hypothetical protein
MAIKTTGAEFWRFYNDDKFWPEGAWHEDTVVKVNGEPVEDYTRETMPDDALVVIDGGVIFLDADGDKSVNFDGHFRKWRKAQDTVSIVVECPTALADAVKAAIKAAGGKVV